MATTKDTAIRLTKENLLLIFSEPDTPKRIAKLAELWAADQEIMFVDPDGVFKTHRDISDMVAKLQSLGPGHVFKEIGDVQVLKEDEEKDLWVTRLKWGVGPPGEAFNLTGEDVVTVENGKITRLYTFLDAQN